MLFNLTLIFDILLTFDHSISFFLLHFVCLSSVHFTFSSWRIGNYPTNAQHDFQPCETYFLCDQSSCKCNTSYLYNGIVIDHDCTLHCDITVVSWAGVDHLLLASGTTSACAGFRYAHCFVGYSGICCVICIFDLSCSRYSLDYCSVGIAAVWRYCCCCYWCKSSLVLVICIASSSVVIFLQIIV
jgi:hypothetical protein